MMEVEQAKRYVDSYERSINRRLEQGAIGRNTKIIRLNNQVLTQYDRMINTGDAVTMSRLQEADAVNAVAAAYEKVAFVQGKLRRARSQKSKDKWAEEEKKALDEKERAERHRDSTIKARVKLEQAAGKASRDYTLAQRISTEASKAAREADAKAAEETRKRTVAQRDATDALTKFSAGFRKHSSDFDNVMTANTRLIDSNRKLRREVESATDSLGTYAWEHRKLLDMMRDPNASSSALANQVRRTGRAFTVMERNVRDATASVRTHMAEEAKAAARSPFGRRNRRDLPDIEGSLARNLGALTPLGTVTPGLLIPLAAGFVAAAQGAAAAA